MGDYLRVQAERRNGMCVLRVSGELDRATADPFVRHADAVVRAIPGPVAIDLTGLKFIDVAGVRVLTQLLRRLSASRLADVSRCTPAVRRVLRLLGMPPPDYWLTAQRATALPPTRELADRIERAVFDADETQRATAGTIARLQDTCIRVASTLERTGLTREQARQTLTRAKAAREILTRSRVTG
jgi:anti-anti-sigma factor